MGFFTNEEISDPIKLADKLYIYLSIFFQKNAAAAIAQLTPPSNYNLLAPLFKVSRHELDLRKTEMHYADDFMTLITQVKPRNLELHQYSPEHRLLLEKIIVRLQVIVAAEEKTELSNRSFMVEMKKALTEITQRYERVAGHLEEMKQKSSL